MATPKLRFKEFDGDWYFRKIGDISECIVPGRNKPKLFDGDIPWVTTPDLKDKTYVSDTRSNYYISEDEAKSVGSKIVPTNSVIMSCVGDLGLFAINTKPIVINQQLHAFILDDHKYSSIFVLNALSKNQDYIEKVATKTALPYLNKDNCNSIPLFLCSFKEQTKIASFLSNVDEKISQLTQKHELLSQYKQGMMQKLFSQQTRFKADDGSEFGEWEEWKFASCIDIFDNLRKPVSASERKVGFTPYYGANGIQSYIDGYTHEGEFILIAEDGANDLINYPVQYVNGKIWVNNHAHVVSGKQHIVDNKFLKYRLGSIDFTKYLVGGGRAKLNAGAMKEIAFLLPCLEEQTKIANFLSAIDQKIELVAQQIEQAKTWKKGLLQQMFV
jgi:type I restriction enzyme S subunit